MNRQRVTEGMVAAGEAHLGVVILAATAEGLARLLDDIAAEIDPPVDGHGVDWTKVAETGFRAAFTCLNNAKGDAQALNVAAPITAHTPAGGFAGQRDAYTDARPKAAGTPRVSAKVVGDFVYVTIRKP